MPITESAMLHWLKLKYIIETKDTLDFSKTPLPTKHCLFYWY